MTEQDKQHLEWLYRGLAMTGFVIANYPIEEIPTLSTDLARAMMSETEESGIMAIKPKKKYVRKGD